MAGSDWPALDYRSWKDTLATVHQWVQIVGKIRFRSMPWQNHSWHSTLYISPRGLTTHAVPHPAGTFQIEFDFIRHVLRIESATSELFEMGLYPRTVSDFYREIMDLMEKTGLPVKIYPRPNELEKAIPFDENHEDRSYDAPAVRNFWETLVKVHAVFTRFRSTFLGKCSPVHLFWGAFDLAVTRFSGRTAPLHPGGMPNMPLDVMQEAYSHEVSSAGFWPGSEAFPQPAFYSYCYPVPEEFSRQPVGPDKAFYSQEMGEFFLLYSDVAESTDPEGTLMQFLQTTYEAAALTGKWDREALEKPVKN